MVNFEEQNKIEQLHCSPLYVTVVHSVPTHGTSFSQRDSRLSHKIKAIVRQPVYDGAQSLEAHGIQKELKRIECVLLALDTIFVLYYPEIHFSENCFLGTNKAVGSVSFHNMVVRFLEHCRTTLDTMVSNGLINSVSDQILVQNENT